MSIVKKLVEFGVIEEFNDWAQHFLAGSKGQVKTDPAIIEFVENILSQEFPNDSSKVNNCKLAPWIVNIVRTLGLNQVSDAEINKIKVIIDWFKSSGTEVPIKSKDLNAAYDYVLSKKPKDQQNKKENQPEADNEEESAYLDAEKSGRIRRISSIADGSRRIWVEVLDPQWLTEPGELNPARKWGVRCQSETQHGFISTSMSNIQLIGPPKNNPNGPWSTQCAIAGIKSAKTIKEVKQEDNQMPSSQKTGAGYDDAAERIVDFLCYNSFAKENFIVFTNYDNTIPNVEHSGLYGGSVFLINLMRERTALFNKIIDSRPDIFENNRQLIISVMGQEWFDERELKLEDIINQGPVAYIQKFDRLVNRFGDVAVDMLVKRIDLIGLNKTNPDLIMGTLSSFLGRIPSALFIELFKNINLKEYIENYVNDFKELVRVSSELKEYKKLFDYLVIDNPGIVMQAFGKNLSGVMNFMKYASSPHKREHQDAKIDEKKEQYYRYKDEPYRNPDGSLVLNPDGTRSTYKKLVWIPDDLSIMKQTERKKFLENNKELIKTWIKGSDFEKNMHYTRLLVKEMSEQEAKKFIESSGYKQKIIDYYNERYEQYKKDLKLGDEYIRQKYGVKIQGVFNKTAIQKIKPGILSFYDSFKMGKPNERKIPLSELRANLNTLKNYFANDSKQTDSKAKAIEGFTEFLELYKKNGASDEELMKLINLVDSSNLKTASLAELFYSKSLDTLNPKLRSKMFVELKPFFEKMGYHGQKSYENLLKKISTIRYNVNSGDFIVFLGNEGKKIKYNLSDRKHKVIDVRNVYKDGSTDEENKTQDDVYEYNGQVLVGEDDNLGVYGGQNIWVPSSRFKINIDYILEGQPVSLSETINKIDLQYKKIKKIINESETGKKPRYSAIVLDENSKSLLQNIIHNLVESGQIGNDWKISADHVTINMGSIYDESLLGNDVSIKIEGIGTNEMVAALKVSVDRELNFSGRTPHITLAFNKLNGAKPVMSNQINKWMPFRNLILKGTIKHVF